MTDPTQVMFDEMTFSMHAACAFDDALTRLLDEPASEEELKGAVEVRRPSCECRKLWI